MEIVMGILAGICTGLGLGGSSVLILLLTLFLNFEQHVAQATNLICFIPSAIISIIINTKKKNINFKNAIPFCVCGVIGSVFGSIVSGKMNVVTLRKYFGFFLFFICIYEIYSYYMLYIKNKKKT